MKTVSRKILMLLCALIPAVVAQAQNTEEENKSPEEVAQEEANRLEKLLGLQPHQTFYIDSTLQHDMRGMYEELEALRLSGTQELTAYKQIREKWIARIDSSYVRIMTEDQWTLYRKSIGKLSKEELKAYRAKEKAKRKAAKAK